jgi:6-pyruvoyltetrahydropterin/6-carboxytetrahydropterin synthase
MPPANWFRSTKSIRNLPCAHRRWKHDGDCALVHGYSREFHFIFSCKERTENGFVMDFGDLKPLKAFLEEHFDHRLLLDADDPLLPQFRALEAEGACKLVVFEDVGMEGSAHFVYDWAAPWVKEQTGGRVELEQVECRENDKNSAIYRPLS